MEKPNFLVRFIIEKGGIKMLTKVFEALKGSKTYVLAVLGILVAVAGHFWGPINIGTLTIPQMSWNEVWAIVWNGGLFAALRHGVDNSPTA